MHECLHHFINYAILCYHVPLPSMREAISPIAGFIACLTPAGRLHSVFAFDAGNVTLRLVNFIVHKTSKRRERERRLPSSFDDGRFLCTYQLFFFADRKENNIRTNDRRRSYRYRNSFARQSSS